MALIIVPSIGVLFKPPYSQVHQRQTERTKGQTVTHVRIGKKNIKDLIFDHQVGKYPA